jgi:hypothetical protein
MSPAAIQKEIAQQIGISLYIKKTLGIHQQLTGIRVLDTAMFIKHY